jgi:hypothetical protein
MPIDYKYFCVNRSSTIAATASSWVRGCQFWRLTGIGAIGGERWLVATDRRRVVLGLAFGVHVGSRGAIGGLRNFIHFSGFCNFLHRRVSAMPDRYYLSEIDGGTICYSGFSMRWAVMWKFEWCQIYRQIRDLRLVL